MINFNYPLIGGKLIERKISEWKAEGFAIGFEKGFAKGYAQGMAQANAEWSAWNKRRIKAEINGAPFSEPPPDDSQTAPKER